MAGPEKPSDHWTVIGPDGKAVKFGSWEELEAQKSSPSASPSATSDAPKRVSGSTLLASTAPKPPAPESSSNLTLAEQSDPGLDVRRAIEVKKKEVAAPRPNGASSAKMPTAEPAEEKAPESIEEIDSKSLIEEDEEESPLSMRDAIEVEEEASPISLKDAIHDEDDLVEVVSLADMVVVPDKQHPALTSPLPPARGRLKTLPPGGGSLPPTIRPDSKPPSSGEKRTETKPVAKATKAAATTSTRTTSARAAIAEEPPRRGWAAPVSIIAIAATAFLVWRMTSTPIATEPTPPPPEPTATPTATTATATTPPPPEPTPPPPEPTATATAPTTAPEPTATAITTARPTHAVPTASAAETTATPPPTPAGGGSMSELLDSAGAAKRGGDYAKARSLYLRVLTQNPNNVEANGGLGDIARAQGDLAGAKASYERALAASPTYGPAQLGLADTEWDVGNKGAAKRIYAQIVERQGDRAPARAQQRSAPE